MCKRTGKTLILVIVITTSSFCSMKAFGLDPMGPPSAGLKKGHFGAGADYSYTRMNFSLENGTIVDSVYKFGALASKTTTNVGSVKIEHSKMRKIYANIGYGLTDNIEVFIRVGGMNMEFNSDFFPTTTAESKEYKSDTGPAIGFGTKVTVYKKGKLTLGGLFQISQASSGATLHSTESTDEKIKLNITEIQIAAGPTYQLTDKIAIYGGPFWHFIDFGGSRIHGSKQIEGDPSQAEKKISDVSYSINDISGLGVYVGAQVEFLKNTFYCIEYQHTSYADALAMSIRWKF